MMRDKLQVRFDEKSIDKILRDLDTCQLPGAAVGVAIEGRPVYRKGFGLANMELPVILTPHTRMRIYSTTKHFTCLAYLLLCEEGKAGIDDPIGKYLPELHPVTHAVTMRQLMSNTGGLRDACEIRWFFGGIKETVPARDLLALYRDILDVNFAPGVAWCYNNGGFHILSAVIEKLADRPLEEVFYGRIFEPVGMHDTVLRRTDTDFVQNSAAMHMTSPRGGYERTYLPGELLGEGGLVSTVDDMLRWLRHMDNPVVGKAQTWSLIRASQALNGGAKTGYGLGLSVGDYRGVATISHAGGGFGANSQMIKVPGAGLDVIVLVNRNDISAIEVAANIVEACLDLRSEAASNATCRFSGLFRSPITGRVIRLYDQDGNQMALVDGVEEWPLLLRDDTVLRLKRSSSSNVALVPYPNQAQPDKIRLEYFGGSDELPSVGGESASNAQSILGDFHAPTIGARLTIASDGGAFYAVTRGHFGSQTYSLERLSDRLWRLVSTDSLGWAGILASDQGGARVTLRNSRLWPISFQRGHH